MLTPSLATASPCYCAQCQITAKVSVRPLVPCSIVNANLERNPVSRSSQVQIARGGIVVTKESLRTLVQWMVAIFGEVRCAQTMNRNRLATPTKAATEQVKAGQKP